MAEHDLMRVAEMISGLGLIANNETDEIAIELTALSKLAARFPDLPLVELNKAIALAVEAEEPLAKKFDAWHMGQLERIQLRRTAGWRMPPNTVKGDRSTIFGNPFELKQYWPEQEVAFCRAWIEGKLADENIQSTYPPWAATHLIERRKKVLAAIPILRGKISTVGAHCRRLVSATIVMQRFYGNARTASPCGWLWAGSVDGERYAPNAASTPCG
jgi:hypothetical protein